MSNPRTTTCTVCALASGLLGGYIAWQISSGLPSQKCQEKNWIWENICNVQTLPESTIKGLSGGIAGVWTGTILGAFFSGLVTIPKRNKTGKG
ncbi:MAG: hypothetical protein AAF208_13525 [Cyanobacteria bacterium P01_A01_bin.45]